MITSPIDILRDLIAFKSISGQDNSNIVSYLEAQLKMLGFNSTRIESPSEPKRYNILAEIGPDAPGGLMLSGHLDVVPVTGQNWESDPFVLTQKEDKLFGRGTADMKGFIASSMFALNKIDFKSLKKPLSLLFTYDEEVGCIGSNQISPLLKDHFKYLPSCALIGEPTDFQILRMHSGHVTAKVTFKGKGAHSSDPKLGISAIKGLNEAMRGIFELEEQLKNELVLPQFFSRPFTTLNIGKVSGGSAVNIIPDEAFMVLGFRPLPGTSIDDVFNRIIHASKIYQTDDRVKIEAFIEHISPAMLTHDNKLSEILKPFSLPGSCAAQYATDGGNINKSGIECLIFGPGSIDVAHKANEWVKASDIILASEKLVKIIEKWQE